ncbi:unnamed protein product (macronuclear) [Paramecium tetraurelia]|uniref:Uncharacterized protein n=1 Tax=Paramecium tetraurelia TaxID=5888 RepID=A0D2P1_PARTE|nr:uncharacterized protein GSPATT00012816001 [Paramecium tetraurelia]CAK77308.1 unnamed protein product [Paramecium tetraurelia]|eukprot:XP_001444705.1 hypothetical protein (macronuclear) [Paramecium tetraurelia strain d4-2]
MTTASCVDPRYFTRYHANGTGRDYYVQYSNGGLLKDSQTHFEGVYERAGLAKKEVQVSLPSITPKFQHYPNDGSGRDFYITQIFIIKHRCNEGGQLQNQRKFNYLLNLRSYNKVPEEPLQNDFLRRTSYTTKRQVLKSRQLQSQQRQLTLKLCSPKNTK